MKSKNGFTFVEIVIVVLIIAALAAIAVPRIGASATTAKTNACNTNVGIMNSQIEMYHANTGNWPAALKNVTGNTNYFPDGAPVCPYGKAYKMDKSTYRVAEHSH